MSSSEEEMEDMEAAMAAGFIPADFAHVSNMSKRVKSLLFVQTFKVLVTNKL